MNEITKNERNDHTATKESNMHDPNTPNWVRNASRVDRPDINRWYKPEDGTINGKLIWRGRQEHYQTGDTYNAYVIMEADTGLNIAVSERAGLRDLRNVKIGSRVFIRPGRVKDLDNGRKVQTFEVFAEELESLGDAPRSARGDSGGDNRGDSRGDSGEALAGAHGAVASEDVPF
jgi:hypothetical protein